MRKANDRQAPPNALGTPTSWWLGLSHSNSEIRTLRLTFSARRGLCSPALGPMLGRPRWATPPVPVGRELVRPQCNCPALRRISFDRPSPLLVRRHPNVRVISRVFGQLLVHGRRKVKSMKGECTPSPSNDPRPRSDPGPFLSVRCWRSRTELQVGTPEAFPRLGLQAIAVR